MSARCGVGGRSGHPLACWFRRSVGRNVRTVEAPAELTAEPSLRESPDVPRAGAGSADQEPCEDCRDIGAAGVSETRVRQ